MFTQTDTKGFAKNELGFIPDTLMSDWAPVVKLNIEVGAVLLNVSGTSKEELKVAEPINVTLSPLHIVDTDGVTDAGNGGNM